MSVFIGCCFLNMSLSFKLQPKPISSTLDAGAQAQQLINIECLAPFSSEPTIDITFTWVQLTRCIPYVQLYPQSNCWLETNVYTEYVIIFKRYKFCRFCSDCIPWNFHPGIFPWSGYMLEANLNNFFRLPFAKYETLEDYCVHSIKES